MTVPAVQLSPDCQFNFEEALLLQRSGFPDKARVIYESILARFPTHYDSMHLLGVCLHQERRHSEAAQAIYRAIEIIPSFVSAYVSLADPLMELGRFEEALTSIDRAIVLEPDNAIFHRIRGNALRHLGRTQEAIESHTKAVHLQPEFPDAHNDLGIALLDQLKSSEALQCFERAIQLNNRLSEAHNNCGVALRNLKRPEEALEHFDLALAVKPDIPEAHNNRGLALFELKRHDEALVSYDNAISLKPDFVEVYSNRGNALLELRRFDEALVSYDKAISLNPQFCEAHLNRASVFHELGQLDAALESYDRAIKANPERADALTYKAVIALKLGDYKTGFELYAKRFEGIEGMQSASLSPAANIPRWDGVPFEGNLLLWKEQGVGDEILYASLLSLIAGGKMNVTVLADKRLHSIYKRSFPNIQVFEGNSLADFAPFGAQAAIGELGLLLGIDPGKLSHRRYPYLIADAARRSQIREAVPFNGSTPVCGISWRSAAKNIGERKSVQLRDVAPLITMPDISFVNLQYGDVAAEIEAARSDLGVTIHQIDGLDVTNDIDGLLALIDACDIVFTTSNVTAHLAGAMGKETVVMVPSGNSLLWYWNAAPGNSWYPSVRLVGREPHGDWQRPVSEAVELIRGYLFGAESDGRSRGVLHGADALFR